MMEASPSSGETTVTTTGDTSTLSTSGMGLSAQYMYIIINV